MEKKEFFFNGFLAEVILPDHPNGEWIWKTEFFTAFDAAERALCEKGFVRVHYRIPDRYGSVDAVRLMHRFHSEVVRKFGLQKQAHLFGFSRGGLYAFNYALFYPEAVRSVYLDAPVLDLKSWPPVHTPEYGQMLEEYCLDPETLCRFKGNPIDHLEEFFSWGIPLLVIAGAADEEVPFAQNAGRLINFCLRRKIPLDYYIKPQCGHHPHSLENVTPILDFICGQPHQKGSCIVSAPQNI